MTITPQNFSILVGYGGAITFEVNSDTIDTLVNTTIWWRVYEQEFGIPVAGMLRASIIAKTNTTRDIEHTDSPLSFMVWMNKTDTIDLLGNYYHESTILSALGEVVDSLFGTILIFKE